MLRITQGFLTIVTLLFFTVSAVADDSEKQPIADVFYKTLQEKGLDAATRQYRMLKEKSPDKYSFAETELNNLGYRLLQETSYDDAIAVFKLNIESYPASANAYDSLAEAYMRSGDRESAIEYYEKALAKLADSDMEQQRKETLEKNARGRLNYLLDPESRKKSTVISDFIADNDSHPFGKLHPEAPPETEQFGQLAGVWQCTNKAYVNGQWFSGWPATWVWKYILDGFAVQDLWFQTEENLPPPSASLGRDFAGTNVRIFNTQKEKWEIMWFHNGLNASGSPNGTSQFEAEFSDGQIIMTPVNPGSGPLRRVVFYNISEESFDWKSETSQDDGQTWTAQLKIEGKRIR